MNIPERLIQAVQNRNCIPLVGSGISKQADSNRFPTWRELLSKMISEGEAKQVVSRSAAKELRDLMQKGRLLMVAEALKSMMPTDMYFSFLEEQFDPPDVESSDAHRLILELNPRFIATTNYDHLVEDAYAEVASKSMPVIDYSDAAALQRRLQSLDHSERPFLFKMHGSIDDVENLVLSERDYRRLRYDERGYTTVLSSIFIHYVVLLLGFAFNDEELALCLGHLRHALKGAASPDYILLPASGIGEIETRRFRDDFGLQVITYPADDKHTGVVEFLRALAEYAKGAK